MVEDKTRVAIVTGGARGIGRACAHALADAGYHLALVDLLVPEMERTADEIRARAGQAAIFEADVASFGRAHEIVSEIVRSWGRIDFLLNNAGRSMPKGLLEITEEEWDRTININLKSCFNWCKAVAPVMLEQSGGRMVSMSSLNAHTGGVTSAVSRFAYAAAKAGRVRIHGLVDCGLLHLSQLHADVHQELCQRERRSGVVVQLDRAGGASGVHSVDGPPF